MTNDRDFMNQGGDEEVVIVETTEVEVVTQDIEQTRQSIGETLSELKDKLNPSDMIDQAKHAASDVVHNATEQVKSTAREVSLHAKEGAKDAARGAVSGAVEPIRDMGNDMKERVKSNPLPLLLIGAAAWYFYGRDSNGKAQPGGQYRSMYAEDEPGVMEKAKERVSGAVHSTKEAVTSSVETVRHKATDMGSGLVDNAKSNPLPFLMIGAGAAMLLMNNKRSESESLNYYGESYPEGSEERSLRDKAMEKAERAKERVGEMAHGAMDATTRTLDKGRSTVSRTFETSPLVYGAIAVGAGAALAVMLPKTEFENDLMGDVSDRMREKASGKVKELGHEAKEVARQTVDTAKQTAKEEAHNRGMLK